MRMKYKTLLGIAAFLMLSIAVLPVLAWPPGYSPGYWKHQINAWIDDKGRPQITYDQLMSYTASIDSYYGVVPAPYYEGYQLWPVSEFDYNSDGAFTIEDAYNIFNDHTWNYKWTPLANWYNYVAGLAPWVD